MASYVSLKRSKGEKAFDTFNVILQILIACAMIYPFLNQLALSLNDGTDSARGGIYILPRIFTFSNYQFIFNNPNLVKGAVISVLRVVVGTATCLVATGLLAYVVNIRSFSGKKFMRIFFLFPMYFGGGMIPTYLLMCNLKLTNTFTIYWLPGLVSGYYMLLMTSYMQGLPDSLMESARIEGCSELGVFFRIILPVSVPVFAAVAIYLGVGHWNSWFDVMIYNSNGNWNTLQVYLRRLLLEAEALQKMTDQRMLYEKYKNLSTVSVRSATTMVVVLPIVMIYPFFQKYFVGGITLGSVKE